MIFLLLRLTYWNHFCDESAWPSPGSTHCHQSCYSCVLTHSYPRHWHDLTPWSMITIPWNPIILLPILLTLLTPVPSSLLSLRLSIQWMHCFFPIFQNFLSPVGLHIPHPAKIPWPSSLTVHCKYPYFPHSSFLSHSNLATLNFVKPNHLHCNSVKAVQDDRNISQNSLDSLKIYKQKLKVDVQ